MSSEENKKDIVELETKTETEEQSNNQKKQENKEVEKEENKEDFISGNLASVVSNDFYIHYTFSPYVRELSKREKILWLNAKSFVFSFAPIIASPFLGFLLSVIGIILMILIFTIWEFFDDDIGDIFYARILIAQRIDLDEVSKLQKNRIKAFFSIPKKWYP